MSLVRLIFFTLMARWQFDVKGIIFADYNYKDHNLEVIFKPHKISEKQIHQLVNDAGHDTKKGLASDEAYGKVDDCCKYRTHDCKKGR